MNFLEYAQNKLKSKELSVEKWKEFVEKYIKGEGNQSFINKFKEKSKIKDSTIRPEFSSFLSGKDRGFKYFSNNFNLFIECLPKYDKKALKDNDLKEFLNDFIENKQDESIYPHLYYPYKEDFEEFEFEIFEESKLVDYEKLKDIIKRNKKIYLSGFGKKTFIEKLKKEENGNLIEYIIKKDNIKSDSKNEETKESKKEIKINVKINKINAFKILDNMFKVASNESFNLIKEKIKDNFKYNLNDFCYVCKIVSENKFYLQNIVDFEEIEYKLPEFMIMNDIEEIKFHSNKEQKTKELIIQFLLLWIKESLKEEKKVYNKNSFLAPNKSKFIEIFKTIFNEHKLKSQSMNSKTVEEFIEVFNKNNKIDIQKLKDELFVWKEENIEKITDILLEQQIFKKEYELLKYTLKMLDYEENIFKETEKELLNILVFSYIDTVMNIFEIEDLSKLRTIKHNLTYFILKRNNDFITTEYIENVNLLNDDMLDKTIMKLIINCFKYDVDDVKNNLIRIFDYYNDGDNYYAFDTFNSYYKFNHDLFNRYDFIFKKISEIYKENICCDELSEYFENYFENYYTTSKFPYQAVYLDKIKSKDIVWGNPYYYLILKTKEGDEAKQYYFPVNKNDIEYLSQTDKNYIGKGKYGFNDSNCVNLLLKNSDDFDYFKENYKKLPKELKIYFNKELIDNYIYKEKNENIKKILDDLYEDEYFNSIKQPVITEFKKLIKEYNFKEYFNPYKWLQFEKDNSVYDIDGLLKIIDLVKDFEICVEIITFLYSYIDFFNTKINIKNKYEHKNKDFFYELQNISNEINRLKQFDRKKYQFDEVINKLESYLEKNSVFYNEYSQNSNTKELEYFRTEVIKKSEEILLLIFNENINNVKFLAELYKIFKNIKLESIHSSEFIKQIDIIKLIDAKLLKKIKNENIEFYNIICEELLKQWDVNINSYEDFDLLIKYLKKSPNIISTHNFSDYKTFCEAFKQMEKEYDIKELLNDESFYFTKINPYSLQYLYENNFEKSEEYIINLLLSKHIDNEIMNLLILKYYNFINKENFRKIFSYLPYIFKKNGLEHNFVEDKLKEDYCQHYNKIMEIDDENYLTVLLLFLQRYELSGKSLEKAAKEKYKQFKDNTELAFLSAYYIDDESIKYEAYKNKIFSPKNIDELPLDNQKYFITNEIIMNWDLKKELEENFVNFVNDINIIEKVLVECNLSIYEHSVVLLEKYFNHYKTFINLKLTKDSSDYLINYISNRINDKNMENEYKKLTEKFINNDFIFTNDLVVTSQIKIGNSSGKARLEYSENCNFNEDVFEKIFWNPVSSYLDLSIITKRVELHPEEKEFWKSVLIHSYKFSPLKLKEVLITFK